MKVNEIHGNESGYKEASASPCADFVRKISLTGKALYLVWQGNTVRLPRMEGSSVPYAEQRNNVNDNQKISNIQAVEQKATQDWGGENAN